MRFSPQYIACKNPYCRRGKASLFLLLSFPFLLAMVLLPMNAAMLAEARTSQRISTDAAALAAVQSLVDEKRLIDALEMRNIIETAKKQAQDYANFNPTMGHKVQIRPNPENKKDGDLVFGHWQSGSFNPALLDSPSHLGDVDAVQLTLKRTHQRGNQVPLFGGGLFTLASTHLITSATAVWDRRIYGFRPVGKNNIPLAPIALLSDRSGRHEHSWEYQVEQRNRAERWQWQRSTKSFVPGADGLHEMLVTFGGEAPLDPVRAESLNAVLLQIGAQDVEDSCRQLLEGIGDADLTGFGGQLVLDPKGILVLPGSALFSDVNTLRHCLNNLRLSGEPRVWPLYSGFDAEGLTHLSGFVAAKVAHVSDSGPGVSFVLQATVLSTPTALSAGNRPLNPYAGHVRLVK